MRFFILSKARLRRHNIDIYFDVAHNILIWCFVWYFTGLPTLRIWTFNFNTTRELMISNVLNYRIPSHYFGHFRHTGLLQQISKIFTDSFWFIYLFYQPRIRNLLCFTACICHYHVLMLPQCHAQILEIKRRNTTSNSGLMHHVENVLHQP
jgi:hypothetical protein